MQALTAHTVHRHSKHCQKISGAEAPNTVSCSLSTYIPAGTAMARSAAVDHAHSAALSPCPGCDEYSAHAQEHLPTQAWLAQAGERAGQ